MKAMAVVLAFWLGALPAWAGDWSLTKVLTINHFGSPSENDGFHPEAFALERRLTDRTYYSVGILENSEERMGVTVGYSKIFHQKGRWHFTRNFYLSANYRRLPFIMPIPTLGARYQLTPKTQLVVESVPFHDEGDPYLIVVTGVNFAF